MVLLAKARDCIFWRTPQLLWFPQSHVHCGGYVPSSPTTGACTGFCAPKRPLTKSAIALIAHNEQVYVEIWLAREGGLETLLGSAPMLALTSFSGTSTHVAGQGLEKYPRPRTVCFVHYVEYALFVNGCTENCQQTAMMRDL